MIEHAATGLADRQELDELALGTAREPVGDERRALCCLLRHRGESLEHARGRERLQPPADRPTHGPDPGEAPPPHQLRPPPHRQRQRPRLPPLAASTRASRPDNTNSGVPGTDSASATAVFTVLSMSASDAMRSRGVVGCANRSTGSVPSSQPATVATPPRNSMSFGTLPARKATSPSSAPGARSPRAPAEPPAPSTIRPPATAFVQIGRAHV